MVFLALVLATGEGASFPERAHQGSAFDALVQLRYLQAGECRFSGTGFFIDRRRRLLLTASHNLGLEAERLTLEFRYRTGRANPRVFSWRKPVKVVWFSEQVDMALVQLPPEALEPLGELRLAPDAPADLVPTEHHPGERVLVGGFPGRLCSEEFDPPATWPALSRMRTGYRVDIEDLSGTGGALLHATGEKRTEYALPGGSIFDGHSGAPVLIPQTDIAFAMVSKAWRRTAPGASGHEEHSPIAYALSALIPGNGQPGPLELFGLSFLSEEEVAAGRQTASPAAPPLSRSPSGRR